RRAAVHPLLALPEPEVGARLLRSGAWFGVGGDPAAADLVAALGGRAVPVADEDRAAYHAAACVASNLLVALLDQAYRLAAQAGMPPAALLDLVRGTVDNVAALGPAGALTGPVARGDWATVESHRRAVAALGDADLAGYDAMAALAGRLAGHRAGVEVPCA
ncbi:MAG TPA: DUF2520 domain-containing protein, partial [Acidimicrobiales bacterium]